MSIEQPFSSTDKYDVAVAYRIYPRITRPTPICADDKYALAEVCLKSFRESVASLRVKMWVLLDGCPPEYEALFLRYFDQSNLEFIHLDSVGNAATFKLQLQILLEQHIASLVYCAEDDYYYMPNQFVKMVRILTGHSDVHFVSPYDHPDYYTLGLHRHPTNILEGAQHHWRQAATTCLSFLTTQAILRETTRMFDTYTRRNYDTSIWLSLTKYALLNPVIIYRALTGDRPQWKAIVKAWLFGWHQIFFGKRWNLWVPIPTLATHIESTGLAPTIDWLHTLNNALAELENQ